MLATEEQIARRDANLSVNQRVQREEVQTRQKRLTREKAEAEEESGYDGQIALVAASPSGFIYTACYCEENAYFLCQLLMEQKPNSAFYVVFVSNQDRLVDFWSHRSGDVEGHVVWDYHVFVVEKPHGCGETLVWDLDTVGTLARPCSIQEYAVDVLHAVPSDAHALAYRRGSPRMFRVIPGSDFMRWFASDRSHMRRADGSWHAAPPPYPCIQAQDGCRMNLEAYIDMTSPTLSSLEELEAGGGDLGNPRQGGVFDEGSFLEAFGYVSMEKFSAR